MVLTGAGADGAVGVRKMKEAGGVILVQDPGEAEFAMMPRSAIATGAADFVDPVAKLAARMAEVLHSKRALASMTAEEEPSGRSPRIIAFLRARTGHDFASYKTRHRAAPDRPADAGRPGRTAWRTTPRYLAETPEEAQELFGDLLISVTSFFRDREAFAALAQDGHPGAVRRRGRRRADPRLGRSAAPPARRPTRWRSCCSRKPSGASQLPMSRSSPATSTKARSRPRARGAIRARSRPTSREERLRPLLRRGGRALPRAQGSARRRAVRPPQRAEGPALHAARPDHLPQPADLPGARAAARSCWRCSTTRCKPGGFLFLGSAETADARPELFAPHNREARIYTRQAAQFRPVPSCCTSSRASTAPTCPTPRRQTGRTAALGQRHAAALEQAAPPSALVDEEQPILHLRPVPAASSCRPKGRSATSCPTSSAPSCAPSCAPPCTAPSRAGEPIAHPAGQRRLQRPSQPGRHVRRAAPGRSGTTAPQALVLFLDGGPAPERRRRRTSPTAPAATEVRRLRESCERAQERLSCSRREHESAIQELRIANEELQSINEEYRSTAEELETSKEELQSINEELQTVNAELKSKLDSIAAPTATCRT